MRQSLADRTRTPDFGTLRLSCRPVETQDGAFYGEIFGNPEIAAGHAGDVLDDPARIQAKLTRDIAHWNRQGFGRWLLLHAGQPVGLGGLAVKDGFAGLKLAYHFLPEMWGQGLASEFVRSAVDYAGDALGSEEVFGLVRPSNIASIRVLEKAGFRDAGLHSMHGGPMRELRMAL